MNTLLPEGVRAWLANTVKQRWPEPRPIVPAVLDGLPLGEVHRLAGDGPYGMLLLGRLDEIDGRLALEVLVNSRMDGESYFRVWDDGTIESMEPAPITLQIYDQDSTPEQRAAAEAAYFAHNRVAYAHLQERGFFEE